jgi:hypothetical protein
MTDYRTSRDRVFACGDMRRGQSLVVWAIREGRDCAGAVGAYFEAERRAESPPRHERFSGSTANSPIAVDRSPAA